MSPGRWDGYGSRMDASASFTATAKAKSEVVLAVPLAWGLIASVRKTDREKKLEGLRSGSSVSRPFALPPSKNSLPLVPERKEASRGILSPAQR